LIELYACNGNLQNRDLLDRELVGAVQIWALVNLNKERGPVRKKKGTEF